MTSASGGTWPLRVRLQFTTLRKLLTRFVWIVKFLDSVVNHGTAHNRHHSEGRTAVVASSCFWRRSRCRRCFAALSRRRASLRQASARQTLKPSWRPACGGGAGFAQTRQMRVGPRYSITCFTSRAARFGARCCLGRRSTTSVCRSAAPAFLRARPTVTCQFEDSAQSAFVAIAAGFASSLRRVSASGKK